MDVAELVTTGARIVELSEKLKELRAGRDAIQKDISELEKELMPLVAKHAKIIAEVVGAPVPAASPSPNVNGTSGVPGIPEPTGDVKRRILQFLDQSEPGTSALDVATALRLDPMVVRQVMMDLRRQGG